MNLKGALDEICCYKVVKGIPYLRLKAVTYEQACEVVSDPYLKNLDGTPLTFDTRVEAERWLVENIDERYLPPVAFQSIKPDKDYYKEYLR